MKTKVSIWLADYKYLLKLQFVCCLLFIFNMSGAGIQNAADAGRLGDNLICYIKARYLAYKYNMPFNLKPFLYSNKFNLDDAGIKYQHKEKIYNENTIKNLKPNILYDISYYCVLSAWNKHLFLYQVNLTLPHVNFVQEIKKQISLKKPVSFSLPKDSINIAVHARKPHGQMDIVNFYDINQLKKMRKTHGHPNKFLPDQYYIDQLKRLVSMYPDKQIRAYIFTNKDADAIIEKYSHYLPGVIFIPIQEFYSVDSPLDLIDNTDPPLPWNYPESGVAQELILMSQFDYLIRSHSNFAQIADFIGNHKMVILPKKMGWYRDSNNRKCLVVEDIVIKSRNKNGEMIIQVVKNI